MIITSAQWFPRFTNRFEILLRRKMHCAQNDPQNLSYREVSLKDVAYPKTWNIPDERHHKHGSNTNVLCDGQWENLC